MTDARTALREAAARFGFSATPRLDAELLLAHAMGITRERLLLTLGDHPVPPAFAALVERRAAHEPVAYITGTRAFWTIDLAVGPGALVPRADSETLIEAAVDHFAGTAGPARILDLGTGPGTLLLAALAQWPGASGLGVDASAAALGQARGNAQALGMGARAAFRLGDWGAGLAERFDLILANPPYIATDADLPAEVRGYEPAQALFAGADGLDDYRRIAPQLRALLAPGGVACIEIGWDQGAAVPALLAAEGLSATVRRDLGGRDRCVIAMAGSGG
ncbi:peptide chain release factor N(5)-glutamine methyltransferase [Sphingomonas ginsenosidimutans]|jgi:release factor glutamine methyltransferase|uniref:Release factor glutamine methyltransferase n=2 Tax=Sphingomonas TaxID=13687 RepID=A0A2A4HX22_9SPHN|nr:peptide chain release factor N(5)-glutamine methyltransferase [Sphingomonas ginsenosidimutans]MBY0302041.1 peptide chain release factor N(5)-glutamine methyltransferase [Sphingomonas ginsenosidimutans]PCG08920.1 protein-(glutamine-N5) methyltransferase, release factor-specific [Sphingomonas ginsenosidimutans]